MTSRNMPHPAEAPPALIAFLRGVERRGALFAQLQVGDAEVGDRALVAAMRAFRLAAVQLPIADWPRQFWALILATPELREPGSGQWHSDFAFLSRLGRGPRAALLLRLVAALGEADAASVLGVARPTYRLALQRALPHSADGQPDAVAWRTLGEAAQHAVRDLSAERLAHLARLREAVVLGRRIEPVARVPIAPPVVAPDEAVRRRWTFPAMAAVAAASLLAFVATFFLPDGASLLDDPNAPRVLVAALPPAQAPAATFDAQDAVLTHPDFDQIRGDHGEAVLAEPGFYAWLAAGAPDGQITREAATELPATVTPPSQSTTSAREADENTETENAPL